MATKLDTRQSVNRTALPMVGSAANASLDSILGLVDPQLSKLFEDRNIMLQDGGLLTFTGTTLQFTESLKIAVNQRVSGAAPLVIDLGSTTRTFTLTGAMLYAVINRTAGTAVVTADASTLPAVVAANQEVFLIAKRVDAADGTKRLYFRSGMAMDEGQTVRLGSSGSGTGGGTGDDINSLKYRASFADAFDDKKGVNSNTGFTDDTLYSAGKKLYRLNYDASKTVTATGTAVTISAAPAFTIKVGDLIVLATSDAPKRITAVASQTSVTIESAWTTNPVAAAANISQAVYTVDVTAYDDSGVYESLKTAFSTAAIPTYMITYRDSLALDDVSNDDLAAAQVAFSASTDNSVWSAAGVHTNSIISDNSERVSPNAAGTAFYLRFFANKTSGSGAVNVLDYKVFLYKDSVASQTGSSSLKALARTDGAGTATNASVSLVNGKTRITTTFVQGTETQVYLDGKKIPEFVSATLTPDGAFTRVTGNAIDLDADYSGAGLQVEIITFANTVDNTNTNASSLSAMNDFIGNGLQGYVDQTSGLISVPNSAIVGRAAIPNLANDARVGMALERVSAQVIYEIQGEFGPNGERIFGVQGDDRQLIRLVGSSWINVLDTSGIRPFTNLTGDYVEITFYGTGLNLLCKADATRDIRATVDGGTEGANFIPASGTDVTGGRLYSANTIVSVAYGLTLGIHTIKLRLVTGSINFYGYEVIGGTTVKANSGTAYIGGKKLATSGTSVAYNAAVTGTRGGRVLTYIKSDGTIGQSFQATNAASANSTATDHTNEEALRTYQVREFGVGRATDDFSRIGGSGNQAAFTLDDDTTTLTAVGAVQVSTINNVEVFSPQTNGSGTMTITFVGTGLDMTALGDSTGTNSNANAWQILIDGATTFNLPQVMTSAAAGGYTYKLVSGLPYGTHTVRLVRNVPDIFSYRVKSFTVYGPKKPTLPSGAVELADYFVMADYSATSVGAANSQNATTSPGVLRKSKTREFNYSGTWGTTSIDVLNDLDGWDFDSAVSGATMSYTFYGTGFEYRVNNISGFTANQTISIDGSSNFTASNGSPTGGIGWTGALTTSSSLASGVSFTASTGALSGTPAASFLGGSVKVSGLPLGVHTFKMTTTASIRQFPDVLDIITPIHSYKNLNPSQQNTLAMGLVSIADTRKLSPVKSESPAKGFAQTFGSNSASTTSSTAIPMPEMSVTVKTGTGMIEVSWSAVLLGSTSGAGVAVQLYIDGMPYGPAVQLVQNGANVQQEYSQNIAVPVGAGVHNVQVYWLVTAGTLNVNGAQRSLKVREL